MSATHVALLDSHPTDTDRLQQMLIATPTGKLLVTVPFQGCHSAANVVAATSAAVALQVPRESIVQGLQALHSIPGRAEVVNPVGSPLPHDFMVMVDAGRCPEGLGDLLDSLKAQEGVKRVILVLGCAAEEPLADRAMYMEIACTKADILFLTADNPGKEPVDKILADMLAGLPDEILRAAHFPEPDHLMQDPCEAPWWLERKLFEFQAKIRRHVVKDRGLAIRVAIGTARPGDVVLVAGKGEQEWQLVASPRGGAMRGWFSDHFECQSALANLHLLENLHTRGYSVTMDRRQLPWKLKVRQVAVGKEVETEVNEKKHIALEKTKRKARASQQPVAA